MKKNILKRHHDLWEEGIENKQKIVEIPKLKVLVFIANIVVAVKKSVIH
jgi:hypothetical protein